MTTLIQPRLSALIEARYSPRAFAPTALPDGYAELLLEAARRAPSGGNSQPWRFIYAEKSRQAEVFDKIADTLTGNNRIWAPKAPMLVAAFAQEVNAEGKPISSARYDCGAALAWLTVQAQELGLYVHQMGGFDRQNLVEAFAIPQGFVPVTISAVGYLGHPGGLPEDLRERELTRTTRKPLVEVAFTGSFNS